MAFCLFSKNKIEGFFFDEHTPKEFRLLDSQDGPWEWKRQVKSKKRFEAKITELNLKARDMPRVVE